MKKFAKYFFTLMATLIAMVSRAQAEVEMADGMRANGKIYVVVGIILIVLLGLVVYLFMMDKKLDKLEKQLESGKRNTP